jgi:hypothetical protein
MLTMMISWSSCQTTPPPDVVVQTYRPVLQMPTPPKYPKDLNWKYEESMELYTLPDSDFRTLIEWRLRVEGFFNKVKIIWSLIDDKEVDTQKE